MSARPRSTTLASVYLLCEGSRTTFTLIFRPSTRPQRGQGIRGRRVHDSSPRRGVLERELGVAGSLHLDDEDDAALGVADGEGPARVLVRDGIHALEFAVRAAIDDPAAKLGLRVGIIHVHDGERDARIAPRVLGL